MESENMESAPESEKPVTAGNILEVVEILLKDPAALIKLLVQPGRTRICYWLLAIALISTLGYGLIVGMFSGGTQLWAAPLKLAGGLLFSSLLCWPSFYIFASMGGADLSIRNASLLLLCAIALAAVLLVGVAPVAWVFSQSTESIAFMGTLHLGFWLVALLGLSSVLGKGLRAFKFSNQAYLRVWFTIFVLVTLQMTTTLRPIIGSAPNLMPSGKKFFLAHWGDSLNRDISHDRRQHGQSSAHKNPFVE